VSNLLHDISYSAPEVVEGKQYDEQVDDWSIGAILYFLLTSRHAFALDGTEDDAIHKLVLSGKYDTNNPSWPEVSNEGKCCKVQASVVSWKLTYAIIYSQIPNS
jgi:serine/threonine protein kinase